MKIYRYRFWIYFAIGWLFYAISLAVVFVAQSGRFYGGILPQLINNLLPAVLLGIGAVKICERMEWSKRTSFKVKHVLLAFIFAFSWGFWTLFLNSATNFIDTGRWQFILWNSYALQWQTLSGLMAYFIIAGAVYIRKFDENLRIAERRRAEMQILAAKAESARRHAELFALRSQLNPHFLFNTLHSLMALVRTNAPAAEQAIERFSEMLRYVLHSQSKDGEKALDVSFGEELRFIENYLELEKMRLGERLRMKIEIEPAAAVFRLPAFLVQPLVENAVNRGIAPKASGGEISLNAFLQNKFFFIVVKDNGAGTDMTEALQSKGFGLRLIHEMLSAKYGDRANLQIETFPGKGFTATIKIPQE